MPADVFGHSYQFLHRQQILSFEEIVRLTTILVVQGVRKIRLTGGEPLLRHQLQSLVSKIAAIDGVADIALTTNGYLLSKYALPLYEAGLKRLTVSLDTLNPDRFKVLAGVGLELSQLMAGIERALEIGFERMKLNTVIQKGVNDDEITAIANFGRQRGLICRFIEYMDVGNLNHWSFDDVVTAKDIITRISKRWPLVPVEANYSGEVASRYRYQDGFGEVGIIASVTRPFCGDCTRMRLSADGSIYTCLFAEKGFDIKTPMRNGASDSELAAMLSDLWRARDDMYSELRFSEGERRERKKVEMYHIGG
jgi:cyclic pyranopterin phosphate synthase